MQKLKSALLAAVVAAPLALFAATPGVAAAPAHRVASVKLTGYTRVVKGVTHYRSLGAVHATMQILPRRSGQVTVSLQHRSGQKWITDQTATFATTTTGSAWVGLVSGNRKWTYRYVVSTVASPRVATPAFIVD
ncbi:hypothetical protein KOI35_15885 [Actinoplanes bogorensis]|uniref:Uncharacterized protein n=1 Tax=Paractinoplanes bogorensis TaxID=1610840 RepID=A0ABS5YQI1_9ACTN|nr:hypothetical protein [Actinoplanes bogorensis]MBU2664984.1 hypothetical protein [Actinoplanes bogorensis]